MTLPSSRLQLWEQHAHILPPYVHRCVHGAGERPGPQNAENTPTLLIYPHEISLSTGLYPLTMSRPHREPSVIPEQKSIKACHARPLLAWGAAHREPVEGGPPDPVTQATSREKGEGHTLAKKRPQGLLRF